jgi:hydroxyacylglutathione hydrolase
MRQIRADLWETRTDSPFPGLTTHAYLWTAPSAGNAMFYSVAGDADFDQLSDLGGIAHQYLSHRDEAGPMLSRISSHFGSRLHAPVIELIDIGRFAHVDVPIGSRHVDSNDVEVIPTPGHSPGSTCYQVRGAGEATYLFTGDTVWLSATGEWTAGYINGISDATVLASSLELLGTLNPDVVISSASAGDHGAHPLDGRPWPDCIDQALSRLLPGESGEISYALGDRS